MAGYRLTYWNKRGRGEQIRLLLNDLGADYEDVHVGGEVFRALQSEQPPRLYFGSVPMLEDGAFRLCQGPAIMRYLADKHEITPSGMQGAARADAIVLGAEDLRIQYFGLFGSDGAEKQKAFVTGRWRTRWLPSFEALLAYEPDTPYFVGERLSHADVAVWDAVDAVLAWVPGATLDGAPRLTQLYQLFRQRPRIAAYLVSDRRPRG